MALVEFHSEPRTLDINEVCFEEEQDIPMLVKNQEKFKALLNGVNVGNDQ